MTGAAPEEKGTAWYATLPLLIGFAAVVALVGGVGFWSARTMISGAIVASGVVQVESNRQVIQHPDGGVVGEILRRDGDTVAAGDVLIRLDGTRLRSELSVVEDQLSEIAARKLRLEAERDGALDLRRDIAVQDQGAGNAAFSAKFESERSLFHVRREALMQEDVLLEEQNRQIDNRIQGIRAQLDALRRQKELLDRQTVDQQALLDQSLTQSSQLLQLQREQAGVQGQVGQLEAEIAELRGQAASNQIARLQLVTARREAALTQLRDIQFQQIELIERQLSLNETLSRLEIRAPVGGIIYNSQVFAVQAVVQAAEPIMYIIPQDQPLIVAARIEAIHIDQIHLGQEVSLRFPAFDQRRLPEVTGRLAQISADVITDQVTQQTYYAATVLPNAAELAGLGDQVLLPGMPVDAFIKTGDRTPLVYLTRPLMAYFDRAFRE